MNSNIVAYIPHPFVNNNPLYLLRKCPIYTFFRIYFSFYSRFAIYSLVRHIENRHFEVQELEFLQYAPKEQGIPYII